MNSSCLYRRYGKCHFIGFTFSSTFVYKRLSERIRKHGVNKTRKKEISQEHAAEEWVVGMGGGVVLKYSVNFMLWYKGSLRCHIIPKCPL